MGAKLSPHKVLVFHSEARTDIKQFLIKSMGAESWSSYLSQIKKIWNNEEHVDILSEQTRVG